jgi:hypothetical protein
MTAAAPVLPIGARRAAGVGVLAGLLTLAVTSILLWQRGDLGRRQVVVAEQVEPGNCVNVSGDNNRSFDVTPCTNPHNGEIVAVIPHPDAEGPYPGEQVTAVWFDDSCRAAIDAYVGDDVMTTTLSAGSVIPDEDDWNDGVQSAVCYVISDTGNDLEESVIGRADELRRAGTVPINELAAGDCFSPTNDQNPFELRSGDVVELMDCSGSYYGLFFGRGSLPFPDDTEFPDNEELSTASTAVCAGRFEAYFDVESSIGYTFRFWRPSRTDWDSGSRDVLCAVLSETELNGPFVPAEYPALANLGTGQCFELLPEQRPETVSQDDHVRPVVCSEPHVGQMIGTGELALDGDFPGVAEVRELTESECRDRFENFVGVPPSESSYGRFPYWFPDQRSWAAGDTRYACAILGDRVLTSSIQGTGE